MPLRVAGQYKYKFCVCFNCFPVIFQATRIDRQEETRKKAKTKKLPPEDERQDKTRILPQYWLIAIALGSSMFQRENQHIHGMSSFFSLSISFQVYVPASKHLSYIPNPSILKHARLTSLHSVGFPFPIPIPVPWFILLYVWFHASEPRGSSGKHPFNSSHNFQQLLTPHSLCPY